MKKTKNGSLMPAGKPGFVYRDESNKFNISFNYQLFNFKFLIGRYLREVREEYIHLTQKDVAERADISVRNLIYIEAGTDASVDAIMQVYLFYVLTGKLPHEKQLQFITFCKQIWLEK